METANAASSMCAPASCSSTPGPSGPSAPTSAEHAPKTLPPGSVRKNSSIRTSNPPPRPASVPPPLLELTGLVATSAAMRQVLSLLARVAPTELTVTLIGETGTGKDVLAHAVHDNSNRVGGPFVVFDCGAIAANLAESELFGHERGSFTGALTSHAGAFERANGGTLFLDEVGELPLDLQPRLLRALENRRVRRVGGTEYRPVDQRVIAATNRDLKELVAAGRFREDLYFRLAAAVVQVPSLRERADDLPVLVPRLLADLGADSLEVAPETYALLRAHDWPGNVRELKNTLARALAFLDSDALQPHHLHLPACDDDGALERLPLGGKSLQCIEKAAIKQTLSRTGGNKAHAAQALGIAVSTLYEKLRKYQLT
jgi:DNA-binding NtrC family response regulator